MFFRSFEHFRLFPLFINTELNYSPAMKALSPVSKRSAFTLVEVLVVVGVIAVLAAITVGLLGPVENAIRTSNAKTQCDKISLALGDFKSTYGEYPMLEGTGDQEDWEELLMDSMRGDKILVRKGGKMQLVEFDEGKSDAERRPFLSLSEFSLDDEDVDAAQKILDPWENPWQYRYNVIEGGKLGKNWFGPTFILISAGSEYEEPVGTEDFFTGDLEEQGVPDLDPDGDDYYFAEMRADNITNFGAQSQ